jgi:ornithine cyclodeaminase
MGERFGVSAVAVSTVREAVVDSDLVVTVTPSREPLVRGDWLRPGTHVTAVGADGPDKRELDAAVLARADKVVVDRRDQCLRFGELHHAVAAGVLAPERVWAELGELAAGTRPGRTSDAEITVADLTGVGVQDAAVAAFVADAAREKGVGRLLDA